YLAEEVIGLDLDDFVQDAAQPYRVLGNVVVNLDDLHCIGHTGADPRPEGVPQLDALPGLHPIPARGRFGVERFSNPAPAVTLDAPLVVTVRHRMRNRAATEEGL